MTESSRASRSFQTGVAAHERDIRDEGLSGLPADMRRQRLIEYFRDRVAAVLGLAPDKVDPDRPLMSLGLDSLSAMDLKIEIDAGLGAKLASVDADGGVRYPRAGGQGERATRRLSDPTIRGVPAVSASGGRSTALARAATALVRASVHANAAPPTTSPGPRRSARNWTSTLFRRAFRRVIAHQERIADDLYRHR